MFKRNKVIGKAVIKYRGDLEYDISVNGEIPITAIFIQQLIEDLQDLGVQKEEFMENFNKYWDDIANGGEE
ncbi:hypothetical protein [Megamonas funiformis]|uniref:hypothetical protein n=1 Tax=Megamonas funiformis TaxID=437897 RepID=UPI003F7EBA28